MRSIAYRLRGSPHNLNDCLDLSSKEKPLEVSLELGTEEIATESGLFKKLFGEYVWRFKDREPVTYKEFYATYLFRTEVGIKKANANLEKSLRRIKSLGIDVKGEDKRFDYW